MIEWITIIFLTVVVIALIGVIVLLLIGMGAAYAAAKRRKE